MGRGSNRFANVYRNALAQMNDAELYESLMRYILTKQDMVTMGYPMEIRGLPECAKIKAPHPNAFKQHFSRRTLSFEEDDSGKGSSVENSEDEDEVAESIELMSKQKAYSHRTCTRCKVVYCTSNTESCTYHWGKVRDGLWQCCYNTTKSLGCTTAPSHVCSGIVPGDNVIPDFRTTRPAPSRPVDGNYGIYALDCEMCFTKRGMQVARISVVNVNGSVIYDTFVAPEEPVIDYNTRFSGILPENLNNAKKTLKEVQQDLLKVIYAESIIIGHGLENDLRALKIMHYTVIDTARIYPHWSGLPMRNSLKVLAQSVLNVTTQEGQHDSIEDARLAKDLTLRKLWEEVGIDPIAPPRVETYGVVHVYPVYQDNTIVYLPILTN